MKDKITTHPRFIRKLEKDLEFLYTNNDYDSFIERFNEYETVTSNINLDLIEMFYHILISKKGEIGHKIKCRLKSDRK